MEDFLDKFQYGVGRIEEAPVPGCFNKFVVGVSNVIQEEGQYKLLRPEVGVLYFANPRLENHYDIAREYSAGIILGGGKCKLTPQNTLTIGGMSGTYGRVPRLVLERLLPSLEKEYSDLFGRPMEVMLDEDCSPAEDNLDKLREIAAVLLENERARTT